MAADWTDALKRARDHAPFLARGLERHEEIARLLTDGAADDALHLAKTAGAGIDDIGVALRREKRALGLVLAIGDLAGAFELDKVMRELSLFADRSLHRAIEAAILRRVPDAQPQGLIGLALGKHGAGELNYSSDIDPILLYDPETLPRRERDEPGEAAQRYAREVVRLLSDVTAEGYVFRVDLRLRPASEVSPLAIPLDAAITHYESSALAWERAAFIRARACAGDIAAGEAFLDHIRPFVWRRSLDFGAIDEVRRLTHRIRDKQTGPREPAPEYNVKLGRGGIREAEFFAQTHQLVHGGRDPSLRRKHTRAALDALAATGRIGADDARCQHQIAASPQQVIPAGIEPVHQFGKGQNRIVAIGARHRPRMPGLAATLDQTMTEIAANARHDRRRQPAFDQKRALLDMQFQIGLDPGQIADRLPGGQRRGVDAQGLQMFAERRAIAAMGCVQFRLRQLPGEHFRAQITGPEPRAFFAAHGDAFDRAAEPLAPARGADQNQQSGDHPGKPVVIAAHRDRIHMAADQYPAFGIRMFGQAEQQVATCVFLDAETIGAGKARKPVQRPGFDIGKRRAADALGIGRQRTDFIERLLGEAFFDRGGHHYAASSSGISTLPITCDRSLMPWAARSSGA